MPRLGSLQGSDGCSRNTCDLFTPSEELSVEGAAKKVASSRAWADSARWQYSHRSPTPPAQAHAQRTEVGFRASQPRRHVQTSMPPAVTCNLRRA